jgi:hypothetical protein
MLTGLLHQVGRLEQQQHGTKRSKRGLLNLATQEITSQHHQHAE